MQGFEGYADVVDPRERYDDLVEESDVDVREPARYAEAREMEAFRSAWVATGVVVDADSRVLLVYDAEEGCWLLPGGTLQRDESLHEGLVREVREETGVDVDPGRVRGVTEYRVENECGDEWTGFRVAFVAATADDTAVGDDLGVADETFTEARWFRDLPRDLFNDDYTRRVVAHARSP
jgi:ADP-ribose pyrophosphatase YjhB (NUDIX family)